MKKLFAISLLAILTVSAAGQGIRTDFDLGGFGVKINPDKRLIIVRTSLELAGMQTELTKDGEQFRKRVLADFKDFDPDLRNKMKIFVDQYRNRHAELSAAELASAFVSMSFTLSPAPGLEEPSRSVDLPGDLLEVLDYSPLVREFYRSAGVSAKIDQYVDEYEVQGEFVEATARDMVRDVLEYLHTRPRLSYIERVKVETQEGKKTLSKYEPVERYRSFTVVPDLFQAKGNINFLNIRDEYIAIIPPKTDLSASEVRRAYLQFVLDPLVLNESIEIQIKLDEIKSLLNKVRKERPSISPDPILAVSRSLVAATDIREEQYRKLRLATNQARRKIALMTTDEDRKAVSDELERVEKELADESILRLSESYETGAVFVFYFAEKLKGVEQSGFDVSGSIRNWLRALDPKSEENRLVENLETSQRARIARQRRKTETVAPLIENPLTRALLDIDVIVEKKNYKDAELRLNGLLNTYENNRIETARIYYSLGRMKSLDAQDTNDPEIVSEKLEVASNYYKRVLQTASPDDKALVSLTYFALGRIYEHFDQDEYAMKIYEAALQIGNVEEGAFEQAFEAKKSLLAKVAN